MTRFNPFDWNLYVRFGKLKQLVLKFIYKSVIYTQINSFKN